MLQLTFAVSRLKYRDSWREVTINDERSRLPALLNDGIVLIAPNTPAVRCIVLLRVNPDTLSHALQVRAISAESGNCSETFHLKGPLVETIKLEANVDATNKSGLPDQSPNAAHRVSHPQLATLENIYNLVSSQLRSRNSLLQRGTLEIPPHTGVAAISTRVMRALHGGLCR